MDDRLRALAAATGGYLLRAHLLDHGETDRRIRAALREDVLVRMGPGTYAFADEHAARTPEQRHSVVARSVVERLGAHRVALSHVSATIEHGIAQFGADLGTVHVQRLDRGAGRSEAGIQHHTGEFEAGDLVEKDGVLVVAGPRAVWELACRSGQRSSLVLFDSALHTGVVDAEELAEAARRYAAWRGARSAGFVRPAADPGAETVGESLMRFVCIENGLPRPTTQFIVANQDGVVVARTDLAWELYRHLGEFDGLRKYWRDLRPGEDASDVVVREKRREDRARREGFGMSRCVWNEVLPHTSRQTGLLIARDLEQSRSLFTRNRTYIA